jgi:hypothetical protein
MHANSDTPDDAASRLEAERDVEISPAQPDDAHRIDAADVTDISKAEAATAHVKHERAGRMEH